MPRLKTRFVVEFEYDANPDLYGTENLEDMAAMDQVACEEDPERSLQDFLSPSLNEELNIEKTFLVENEVVYD